MVKRVIALAVLVSVISVFGACARQEAKKPQETQQKQQANNVIEIVYGQWENSGHAVAVEADNPAEAPGLREEGKCFLCHNGYAYERQTANLGDIGILKGASCDTCHVGYGRSLMGKGTAKIPLGDIKGGKGALCISCHSGRGKVPDQKSAPHYSVQTDVLLGKSGAEVKGFDYGRSPHDGVTDSCLACHMAEDKKGVSDHSFKMNKAQVANTCGNCHKFKNFNPEAKGDYDGDGKKEGIQTEVSGLMGVVKGAIDKKLDGGKFTSAGGKIQFEDKQAKVLASPPSPEVYNAAWNYFLVKNDGSQGVHNPVYTVQLLQQTYKALMGEDILKAELRK